MPFHQKLAKEKAKLSRRKQQQLQEGTNGDDHQNLKNSEKSGGKFSSLLRSVSPPSSSSMMNNSMSMTALNQPVPQFPPMHTLSQSQYPLPHQHRSTTPSGRDRGTKRDKGDPSQSHLTKRQRNAIAASQKKTTDRLTALNSVSAVGGTAKEFRCSDGITVMPYIVDGNLSVNVKVTNRLYYWLGICGIYTLDLTPTHYIVDGNLSVNVKVINL